MEIVRNAQFGFYAEDYNAEQTLQINPTQGVVNTKLYTTLNSTALASVTIISATEIVLISGHSFVSGDFILLEEQNGGTGYRRFVDKIIGVSGEDIALATPLDFGFCLSAVVNEISYNMAIDGSTTPTLFKAGPPTGVKWWITDTNVLLIDQTAMDISTFGGISALSKGVVARLNIYNGTIIYNITTVRTNGDIAQIFTNTDWTPRAPSGFFAFNSKLNYKYALPLNGNRDEKLEILVQDDLQDLDDANVHINGIVISNKLLV